MSCRRALARNDLLTGLEAAQHLRRHAAHHAYPDFAVFERAVGVFRTIGARVELHWNGHVQAQQVTAATGFSAQNQRWLHYGLGQARTVDRAVIRWPSGLEQTIANPSVDIRHHVKEPDGR